MGVSPETFAEQDKWIGLAVLVVAVLFGGALWLSNRIERWKERGLVRQMERQDDARAAVEQEWADTRQFPAVWTETYPNDWERNEDMARMGALGYVLLSDVDNVDEYGWYKLTYRWEPAYRGEVDIEGLARYR